MFAWQPEAIETIYEVEKLQSKGPRQVRKRMSKTKKATKRESFTPMDLRSCSRRPTDMVILLSEGSQIVALMISRKACNEEQLIR